jgi:hypothetical protein
MAEELKACPFCGGAVRFHSDEDCHGCHYIECSGCKAMFDFSHTTDPENQCDSLHELQCGIAHTWNTRAKLPSKGGEAVAEYQQLSRYENWDRIDKVAFDLGKLGSCPEKFRALYTHPADQAADGVAVSRQLRSVLAMILNALDRDAVEGKQARGEMAEELRALLNGGQE